MPLKVIITKGTAADCKFAKELIFGTKAKGLIADRGYDTNEIVAYTKELDIKAVIPPKKNRIIQRAYDESAYRLRCFVENTFLKLKRFRGIATRYDKTTSSYRGSVVFGCIMLWLKFV
jgi:transposase